MRQIIGQSDCTKMGKYKVVIEQATANAMQPNTQQHRIFIKPKRIRSAFTTEQINYLEKQFKKIPYINGEQRKQVATFLKMSERSVKIWFQNRRMKKKRDSHKEFDVDTNGSKEFGDQLNNVAVLSSTNGQRSYSLSVLSSIADTTAVANSVYTKTNKVDHKEKLTANSKKINFETKTLDPKVNLYKEAASQECLSPYFPQTRTNSATLPYETNMKNKKPLFQERKSSASAEFSINLCKKYKQHTATDTTCYGSTSNEDLKMKKSEPRQQTKRETNYCSPPDYRKTSANEKQTYAPLHNYQPNYNNSAYYPVMPSVYAPPFMSPGGVLWKPVNFMPLMATNSPPLVIPDNHGSPAQQQNKNCKCNCRGSAQHVPINVPPSLQNPYAQYVITVPFPHTSLKF